MAKINSRRLAFPEAGNLTVIRSMAMRVMVWKQTVLWPDGEIPKLSVKETADALELSEANVKVRLLRARLQLREELTRVLGDPERQLVQSHHHPA